MTTNEAAEFLGVHANTIRNWADAGVLPVRRTSGNQRRFDPDDLSRHVLAGAIDQPDASRDDPTEAEARQSKYLSGLLETALAVTASGSLYEVCGALSEATGRALDADAVDVNLYHAESDELEFINGWSARELHPGQWVQGRREPCERYHAGRAIKAGSDGVITDPQAAEIPDDERRLHKYWGERSLVTVALRFEGRLLGILEIASRHAQRMFGEDDLRFAKVAAAHVALALNTSRRLDFEREKLSQTQALLSVTTAAGSTAGRAETLAAICREAGRVLQGDGAELLFFVASRYEMVLAAAWHRDEVAQTGPPSLTVKADAFRRWTDAAQAGSPVYGKGGREGAPLVPPQSGPVPTVYSRLSIPLYSDGQLAAVFDAYSCNPNRLFSGDDLAFAAALGGELELALRQEELMRTERSRVLQLEQLLEAMRQMNTPLDPAKVLDEIVIGIGRSVSVSDANFYEVDEVAGAITATRSFDVLKGAVDQRYRGHRLRLYEFESFALAVSSGRPVVIANLDDPRLGPAEHRLARKFGALSWLVVPVIDNGRVVALLEAAEVREQRDFTENDVRTVEIFAAQAATALSKARAYEREREHSADLSALLAGARGMTASLQLPEVMQGLFDAVSSALGYRYLTIYDWNPASREFTTLAYLVGDRQDEHPEWVHFTYSGDEFPLMSQCVDRHELIICNSLDDPRLDAHEAQEHRVWETKSFMYVPLVYRDEVMGLFEIDYDEPREAITEREATMIEAIAGQAAAAVANAKLFERQRAQAESLERRTAVQDVLVEFAAGLRVRDTAHGVAEEIAAALERFAWFDAGLVLLHDGHGLQSHLAAAFGVPESVKGAAVPSDLLQPLVAVHRQLAADAAMASAGDGAVAGATVKLVRSFDKLTRAGGKVRAVFARPISAPILDREGELVGLVIVDQTTTDGDQAPGADDARGDESYGLLKLICDQAGIAIRAAQRLLGLQRSLERAAVMNELVTAVGSTLDVSEVLRLAVHGMHRVADFERVSFWLVSDDGAAADVVAIEGGTEEAPEESTRRAARSDESPIWQAIDAGAMVRDGDVGRKVQQLDGSLVDCRSIIAIPLTAEGRVVGAVVIGSSAPGHFDAETAVGLEQMVAPVAAALQNAKLYERVRGLHLSNLQALSTALNVKDQYMSWHAPHVAAYAVLLTRRLGYEPELIEEVEKAAYLLDIGKIGVPDDILTKPGPLSAEEYALVCAHAAISGDILKPIFTEELYRAVRHHHERFDGSGYPDGLRGGEAPELARALAVVDAYDAMSSNRPFRRGKSFPEAAAELRACKGTQFDPGLVDEFLGVLDEMDAKRALATAAALDAVKTIDWRMHAMALTGGDDSPARRTVANIVAKVCARHPEVERLRTMVPGEHSYGVVIEHRSDGQQRLRQGAVVQLPDHLLEAASGGADGHNVIAVDDQGTWMSAVAPVTDKRGRVIALVRADVPVETGVRSGALPDDVGETLDSILREAAARMTRIETAANTDGLTGLFNRRHFQERLEQEVARARGSEESVALLFADLDHFKDYNDSAGHSAGDEVLRRVAAIFLRELRRVDVAARYGGEEFVLLLPDTGREGAFEVAERIRLAVENQSGPAGGGAMPTISIGAATLPADAATIAELIDKADWAMYRAKRKGRNRVELFDPNAGYRLGTTSGVAAPGEAQHVRAANAAEELARSAPGEASTPSPSATGRQSERVVAVSALAERLARAVGMPAHEARDVMLAGLLLDSALIDTRAAAPPGELLNSAAIARSLRERWDGKGVPDGVAGEAIPLGARVLAVAVAYQDMLSGDPHRASLRAAGALAEMRRHAGTRFDPALVEVLAEMVEIGA